MLYNSKNTLQCTKGIHSPNIILNRWLTNYQILVQLPKGSGNMKNSNTKIQNNNTIMVKTKNISYKLLYPHQQFRSRLRLQQLTYPNDE